MADVDRLDRGQMLVIAGLVLAVMFVGLAMILNGAIYAENLSTQESSSEASDLLEQRSMHAEKIQQSIDQANDANKTDFSDVNTTLYQLADRQEESASSAGARRGQAVDVELQKTTEGNQLRQFEPRNFTNKQGEASWTLAENVTEAGTFELRLEEQYFLDLAGGSVNNLLQDTDQLLLGGLLFHETFHIEVTYGEDERKWRIYFFQVQDPNISDKDVHIYTEKIDGDDEDDNILTNEGFGTTEETIEALVDQSCSADISSGPAVIDIRNGQPCDNLEFYGNEIVGTQHEIAYRNARTPGLTDSILNGTLENIHEKDEEMFNDIVDEVVDSPSQVCDSIIYDPLGLICPIIGTGTSLVDTILENTGIGPLLDELVSTIDNTGVTGGDRARGTYNLVVDSGEVKSENFHDYSADDGPRQRTIVYSGQLAMQYRADGASLNATSVDVRWEGAEP